MPTGACCREKAVLVTVYVERPRRRISSNHNNPQYHHHPIKQGIVHLKRGGYDRRAELLHYSRNLRESASSSASTPKHTNPQYCSSSQQPKTKITAVKGKHKENPSCFGNWKILIPGFLQLLSGSQVKKEKKKKNKKHKGSITSRIKATVKSLEVQKKRSFTSNIFSKLRSQKWSKR